MREAGRLTAVAVLDSMRATSEGIYEFQLAALAEQRFLTEGAFGGAYRAIVACGENIWNAHYFRNNAQLQAGQLVLMDYAPDFSYYTSDIGRMWPVNGSYDDLQRELYGYMVDYHKVLIDHIRPGVTAEQVMQEAADKMRPVVESTGWSRSSFRDAARATLEFQGHLSHGVGMSVHDVGDYQQTELQEGVVFALDPQMWVPADEIYVRVEDTVAVTSEGVEVLTEAAPLDLSDVEAVIGTEPLLG
jgi:Xaa-Pro aminopeptidase